METINTVNVIECDLRNTNDCEDFVNIYNTQNQCKMSGKTKVDRATSPVYKFSMQEFLNNIDSSIDISKVNDYEIIEESLNDNKLKNASCNTFYSNDICLLNNNTNNQDRKKTKEERKKEREKKKEDDLFKKYQIEQEASHKAIAKSKCGRWIKFNNKIGEGSYKFVYSGYDVQEARNIAWCEFKSVHVDTKEKCSIVFKETEIMLQMNHPHIVRCFHVLKEWTDDNDKLDVKGIVIIEELMGEGTLKNIIKKNFIDGKCILKFSLITRWWHQILDALRYIHSSNLSIIHRDLKADNCFLYSQTNDNCLNVKIGDFGLATHVKTKERKSMLGTLGFMAPEIYEEKYDESVDVYAFGMLMLEVMTNRTPYDECESMVKILSKTLTGEDPMVLQQVEDKWLREIINSCIHSLACYRPTAEELYFHPIFQCKNLTVEVELNHDKLSNKTDVINQFISNMVNCTKMNLRLRFRDKRMLQQLGLDDGESLEFDLDIYKAEDQDIPELIQNLRAEYEDKLSKVYDNPKILDKSTISSNLDKLFLSIELQMKCLVKHLLGRRWKDILNSLVIQKATKIDDGHSELNDESKGDSHKFEMITEYKKMRAQAKRLLDKEIQNYRESSAKGNLENLPNENSDIKSDIKNEMVMDCDCSTIDHIQELTNTVNISFESEELMQRRYSARRQFQVVTSSINTHVMDVHDCPKDLINIDCCNINITSIENNRDSDTCLTEILVPPEQISYNIRIHSMVNLVNSITVVFVIEIPDESKLDGSKWVLSFSCVINELSNVDTFELNFSGMFIDHMDINIKMILQETVQSILKLIKSDSNSILINQNYVFFPKEENYILSVLNHKAMKKSRHEISKPVVNSELHRNYVESIKNIPISDATITENIPQLGAILKSNATNPLPNEFINEKIKTYVESLFTKDNAVLLIKRMENNDKQIIKAHNIPLGTAFVLNDDMHIQNIKRTTIISPSVELNGNVFVRELDKSDLSMDKAINILSLLQEKIEELSSNECYKQSANLINSKILFETKIKSTDQSNSNQNNIGLYAGNILDKQKIIEQVLKQKEEIEKLQLQQNQFLTLLGGDIKPMSTFDFQEVINHQPIYNQLPLNQSNNSIYGTDNNYFYPSYGQPNQAYFNSANFRMPMYNPLNSNFVIPDTFRTSINTFQESLNENSGFSGKDFHLVNSTRNFNVNESIGTVNNQRMFPDLTYSMDRIDSFDKSVHQFPSQGSEQFSEESKMKIMNNPSLLKNIDPNLREQFYQQSYPFFFNVPFGQGGSNVFYDNLKSVSSVPQAQPQYSMKEGNTIGFDEMYAHVLPDDIVSNKESINEMRNESISRSNVITNEAINSAYQNTLTNQNYSERFHETGCNPQKQPIENILVNR